MTKVQFYKVNTDQDRLALAGKLTIKAVTTEMQVFIATESAQQSRQLSDLLWLCSDISFLAHEVVEAASNTSDCPIVISHVDDPGQHHGLLINLQLETPLWHSRFDMTTEFVYDTPQVVQAKRQNFDYFKKRGYPLKFHDMTQHGNV